MKHQHTVHCAIKTMAKTPPTPENNKAMAKRKTNDMKAAVSATSQMRVFEYCWDGVGTWRGWTDYSTSENINKPFSEQITNLKPSHTTQLQQQLSPSSNQTSIEN